MSDDVKPASGTTTADTSAVQTLLEQIAAAVATGVADGISQALVASGAQTAQQQGAQQSVQQAAQAAAQTVASQQGMEAALASLNDDISKLSDQMKQVTSGDVDRATHDTMRAATYADPGSDWQRNSLARDRVAQQLDLAAINVIRAIDARFTDYLSYEAGLWSSNAVATASVMARVSDHFGALPPIAPRSPTGPGNSAG